MGELLQEIEVVVFVDNVGDECGCECDVFVKVSEDDSIESISLFTVAFFLIVSWIWLLRAGGRYKSPEFCLFTEKNLIKVLISVTWIIKRDM